MQNWIVWNDTVIAFNSIAQSTGAVEYTDCFSAEA